MRTIAALLLAITCLFVADAATAQGRRVALVIGNQDYYKGQSVLHNPRKDATDVAGQLQKAGFTLVRGKAQHDLNKASFEAVLREFVQSAQNAREAWVYYSGHGMEIGGVNYLMPTDAGPVTAATVGFQNINVQVILSALEATGVPLKVLILDACRNNPFMPGRTTGGGLAYMNAPPGTLLAYATHPGSLADDGPRGGNSPYAAALVTYMKVQGLQLFAMFMDVGFAVMRETRNRQRPWISSSPIPIQTYLHQPIATVATSVAPPTLAYATEPTPAVAYSNGAAHTYIQEAYVLLGQKRTTEARRILNDGLQLDKRSSTALGYRGFSWFLDGLWERDPETSLRYYRLGFPDLDKAIKDDPAYADVLRHRGNTIMATYRALMALKRKPNDILDKAIVDLRAAVRLEPDKRFNIHFLGMGYLVHGSYHEAIAQFDRAIALYPTYVAPRSGRCMAYKMLKMHQAARLDAEWAAGRDSRLKRQPCMRNNVLDFWTFTAANL